MPNFSLEDEALLARHIEALKPQLVQSAEELVKQTSIYRNRDFGRRQMSLLLSIASSEPNPEVLSAWVKGQIGKDTDRGPWRGGFGARALKKIDDLRTVVQQELKNAGGWPKREGASVAERDLWHRSVTLFFGYARWHMLYFSAEQEQA